MKKTLLVVFVAIVAVVASWIFAPDKAGEQTRKNAAPMNTAQDVPEPTLLERLTNASQQPTDDPDQALADFEQCSEHAAEDGMENLLPALVRRLADASIKHGSPDQLADNAILLHDRGYEEDAKPMLEGAEEALEVELPDESGLNYRYVQVAKRLGWLEWNAPRELDDAGRYGIEAHQQFQDYFREKVSPRCHAAGLYPANVIADLDRLSKLAVDGYQELRRQDMIDGYALQARAAWLRFENSQNNEGTVNRKKGKRSFSPKAMLRGEEDFSEIWTYQYTKPFVVFTEKPFDTPKNQQFLDETIAMLRQMHEWFDEQFIQPMNLKRQRPQFSAEQAEEEGWPIEIILFAHRSEYNRYVLESTGIEAVNASAYYFPLEEVIIACVPKPEEDQDWHRSRIANAAFLLLSDFYAVDPAFDMDQLQSRPRWSSLLVQDGLADCVASDTKTGGGIEAEYEFNQLSDVRLRSFKNIYEILGDNVLFRIRDLVGVRSYGEASRLAIERARELKKNPMWAAENAVGMYQPSASMAAQFFQHYQRDGEFIYRDAWWGFLNDEYNGKHALSSYADTTGVEAFKKWFRIEDDAGWEAIEQEFIDFVLALSPPDEPEEELEDEEAPSDD